MDAATIDAAMPTGPVSGSAAADRIAAALGAPNVSGLKTVVSAFVVRQFVDCGLLIDLSATPETTLHHPGQVEEVCRREDLADLPQGRRVPGHGLLLRRRHRYHARGRTRRE
ncbi:hypothetical protein [Streptomyces sp. 130]|uniref:hypothetical protein n=1 Tax=Streptomyces sp. 130 TaxID=2591006 RepID=UPI0021B10618|nr:hypothetical protein [Streptomyces sp. 130]